MLFYLKPSYGKRSFRMRLSGNFQPFASLDWLCDRSEGIVWHGAIISWLRHGILSLVVQVSNQWVAPRSTLPFTLPRSIKWVPRTPGNLVVKRKLSAPSCSAVLGQFGPNHKMGAIKLFFFNEPFHHILNALRTQFSARF